MKQFDWEKFKNENIAVHCKTKEEAEDFCNQMHKHGMKWSSGRDYSKNTCFNVFYNKTCYYGDGEYSGLEYAKKKGREILEWSDYMQKDFTKADLKDGMVVELRNGEVGLVLNTKILMHFGNYEIERFREDLTFNEGKKEDVMKVYSAKTDKVINLLDIFYSLNLEPIWERDETLRVTTEEMRQKLEELTGKKIEIEPTRQEIIGMCYEFCKKQDCPRKLHFAPIWKLLF